MSNLLAIADIIEDAMMHREVCPHAGGGAYQRVRDIAHLVKDGSLGPDEARHLALLALKSALDTPRLPDALTKRVQSRRADMELHHA
ncbi:hypothetical protein [Bosea vestrisii]|uniref:Uncharacterized protein n=1 Tax=Bosea vestrisii TaxID=151416 RepID=A0ABW0HB59_9HYPH